MLVLTIILIFLILLYAVRIMNNEDLVKNNSKDNLTDKANIKNARKHFAKKKEYKYMLIASIITLIIVLICDFTSLEATIIDYFSYDFYAEKEMNKTLYLLPIYIFVIRQIIIEVKIGEFLLKYYKVDEPVLEENILKGILYKQKKTPPTPQQTNIKKEEIKQEEIPKKEN